MPLSLKIKAFTLAEVLITLGIIGIVAALTIPTLIANNQKAQTVAKLKKIYSVLSQAVKMSENVNGNVSTWDWGGGSSSLTARESFDIYWAPYLKIAKYCSSYGNCGYTRPDPWKFVNGGDAPIYVVTNIRTAVILNDGVLVDVYGDTDKMIIVDLNVSSPPNKSGIDVFEFVLDSNRGLVPYGYNFTSTNMDNVCLTWNAFGCAAKLMKDGWEMKDDYPWN